MADLCFAAPVPVGQEERVAAWLDALRHPDRDRDSVLHHAGIRLGRTYVQVVKEKPVTIVHFDVLDPERAFRILDRSDEPWTRSFWSFLQKAEAFHPEPRSPLDRLMDEVAPTWNALRDDLVRK